MFDEDEEAQLDQSYTSIGSAGSGGGGAGARPGSESMRMRPGTTGASGAGGIRPFFAANAAFKRNVQSRGSPAVAEGTAGMATFSAVDANFGESLYDLMAEDERTNSLDALGGEKLTRIKRGLWFIIRGQRIHTMEAVTDFLEQVKEEMGRQAMRDETSRAGGTTKFVENMVANSMMESMNPSSSFSNMPTSSTNDFFGSQASSNASVFSAQNNVVSASIASASAAGGSSGGGEAGEGNGSGTGSPATGSPAGVSPPQASFSSFASGTMNTSALSALMRASSPGSSSRQGKRNNNNNNQHVRASTATRKDRKLKRQQLKTPSSKSGNRSDDNNDQKTPSGIEDDVKRLLGEDGDDDENDNNNNEVVDEEEDGEEEDGENNSSDGAGGGGGGDSGTEEQQRQHQQKKKYRARQVLDEPIENDEQHDQRMITEKIEEWQDLVSLFIVTSQVFVLISVGVHFGFNIPHNVGSIVVDKLLGDLVAWISILYRCFAPWKEHGIWHFDWKTRFCRYVTSPAFYIDIIGAFPLDLVAFGLGGEHRCAIYRSDRCGIAGGHWSLNRVLQCRGMFTNFGAVAETLFLRRGLHPILGRVAEVLLFLLCLCHSVSCIWAFMLSRGDKAGLDEFFDPGFEQKAYSFQYFIVMDWAIKSLVGLSPRGTSFPEHALDQAFVIVTTIMGVAIFTNFIATIKLYFDRDCPEKTHAQLQDETIDMVQYMHLTEDFRDDCLLYFNHMFTARFHMSGMRDFQDDLAGGLSRKMRLVVGKELVHRVPLLKPFENNEGFIVSLMQRIEPLVLPPNTVIFKKDESGSTMLVIVKGRVDVLNEDGGVIVTLGPGAFFGEVALLMETPRTATVQSCNNFVNVLCLDRRQMSELIMLFPEIAPILMKEMVKRMHELNEQKQRKEKLQKEKEEALQREKEAKEKLKEMKGEGEEKQQEQ